MRLLVFFVLGVILFQSSDLFSQDTRLIFMENNHVYELITKLQSRGILLGLNPDNYPYTYQEVIDEMEATSDEDLTGIEKSWFSMLSKAVLPKKDFNKDDVIIDLGAEGGLQANNTERRDMYRPSSNLLYVWPLLELNPTLRIDKLVLNANVKFDYFYDRDPDGIDAVNRWYTRNEKGYVGYSTDKISAYFGRYSSHWGTYGQHSALVSNNPRTYDRIDVKLKTKYLQITTLFGFLDNIDGDGIFDGTSLEDLESRRRFLSSKRLDWRPNKDLMISYRESILYSGYRAIPELKYLLPVNSATFLADNTPRNDVINLLFGVSVWKRIKRLTLRGELILDDIIFNRVERGITERGTFSWIFNSTYALKNSPVNLNFTSEIISYQSYNTDQAEGRYLYLGKGLATPFNDYVFNEIRTDLFLDDKIRGLRITPYTGILLQGEQEINQEFNSSYEDGSAFEYVLTGTVESIYRMGVNILYSPNQHWWVKADLGLNHFLNEDNISSKTSTRILGMIEAGFRVGLSISE